MAMEPQRPRKSPPPVTVIVPCFNEDEGIPSLMGRLSALQADGGHGWEVLLVDDGSDDLTFARLLSYSRTYSWVRVLRHPTNLGLGAALRTGIEHAQAPIICAIDSDCTYPPERLPELVGLLDDGAEIATASAWHPESQAAEGSKFRIMLSKAVSGCYKLLIGQDVHTFTCLFRAYRADSLRRVPFRADGFAAVAEIMLRSMLAGYRVRELPMRLEKRKFGESKLKVGDAIAAHAGLLSMTAALVGTRWLRERFRRRPDPLVAPTSERPAA
jgi:dolichol-phosphate mannosyltransferase